LSHLDLENELRAHVKKRRIILGIICAIFFVIAISFTIAYEQSKVIEEIDYFFGKHQSVSYNKNLLWGIMIGWVILIPLVIVLIGDFIFTKIATVKVGENYITLYRGLLHTNLYVNGEYKNGLIFGYYLECSLPDGTKVNASLGKWSAHLTFTNGYPAVDV